MSKEAVMRKLFVSSYYVALFLLSMAGTFFAYGCVGAPDRLVTSYGIYEGDTDAHGKDVPWNTSGGVEGSFMLIGLEFPISYPDNDVAAIHTAQKADVEKLQDELQAMRKLIEEQKLNLALLAQRAEASEDLAEAAVRHAESHDREPSGPNTEGD